MLPTMFTDHNNANGGGARVVRGGHGGGGGDCKQCTYRCLRARADVNVAREYCADFLDASVVDVQRSRRKDLATYQPGLGRSTTNAKFWIPAGRLSTWLDVGRVLDLGRILLPSGQLRKNILNFRKRFRKIEVQHGVQCGGPLLECRQGGCAEGTTKLVHGHHLIPKQLVRVLEKCRELMVRY